MPGNIVNLTPQDIAQWPKPNYVDPEERAWMPEYAGVLYGVATLMVGLRMWLRWTKRAGGLGIDDALLICSWLCVSWFTVLAIIGAEVYHTDRHVWDIPISTFPTMAKVTWLAELAFLLTGCFVKVSVLLFYRRLVETTCSIGWIFAVWSAIAITVAYTLAFILALIFNCTPTEAYWKSFDLIYAATVDYHCVDTTVINLLAGIMAAVSDLYAVALPCIMMRNLTLPLRQKIALNVIFSLGLLVVGASGVRTYWLWQCGHSADVSSAIFNVYVWSQLELTLGIMCCSAPSLRILFREYLSDTLSRLKRSVNSSRSRSRRDSDVEQVIIRRVDTPTDLQGRTDFSAKHTPTCSSVTAKSYEAMPSVDAKDNLQYSSSPPPLSSYNYSYPTSPKAAKVMTRESPPSPSQYLIKTPADYESYNLQNMEKYRVSAQARQSQEAARTRSRSYGQEFGTGIPVSHSWLHME